MLQMAYALTLTLIRPLWWLLSIRLLTRPIVGSAGGQRRVLLLAHNELMARYARAVADALRGDPRITIRFTRAPFVDRGVPLSEIQRRVDVPYIPFWRTLVMWWDLVVATDHFPVAAYHPRIPKLFVSHGLYTGKILAGSDYIYGPRALRWNGRPLYAVMFAAGKIERDCAVHVNPRLAGRIAIVGEPLVDLLLERNRNRCEIRTMLGLGSKPVVLIMSSWGRHSLINTVGPSILETATDLIDKYHFILSLHPRNFTRGAKSTSFVEFLDQQRRVGITVVEMGEQWLDYLAAADLAISDFTSLCLYFLQLTRPLLLIPFSRELMFDDCSPMARLCQAVPQLKSHTQLEQAIREALSQPPSTEARNLAEEMVQNRNKSSQKIAERISAMLGLLDPQERSNHH